jgi:VanZ family protein
MNPKIRTVLRWLPAILWMVMIFAFSSQPGGGSGALSRLIMGYLARVGIDFQAWFGADAVWVLRKCAHFTEYMLLFFWLHLAISTHLPWKKARWWAVGGVAFYACTDEFHQRFVAGRVSDILDVSIDTAGGCMGLILLSLAMIVLMKRRPRQAIVSRINQER